MANEILPYIEMCQRENSNSLQRGMNYKINANYSIILMSQRPNAPYNDRVEGDGTVIIYEGHDIPNSRYGINPKEVDQQERTSNGKLTENGKFSKAVTDYKNGRRQPEKVRVYEKIHSGIWSYNGTFDLVDAWKEDDGTRKVFKFKLIATDEIDPISVPIIELDHQRVIPKAVKLEVWKRDGGKCVICGQTTELHFDHIIPYSKGGTSLKAENIQLMCARHNLQKRDKIE